MIVLLLAGAFVCVVHAALPPGFGGTLRLPLTGPAVLPHPAQVESPLEASLADQVFDPIGSLVVATERDGWLRLTPHQNIRCHRRRDIQAADIAASLRRLEHGNGAHWTAPIMRENGRMLIESDGEAIRIRLRDRHFNAERWLSARPLGLMLGPGTGTGPFRPRIHGSALRLHQFRNAPRGAPYLQSVRFVPTENRDQELRLLVLGRLDGSWFGSSLYGRESRATARQSGGPAASVLLIPHGERRSELATLARLIDRSRLARAGLTPAAAITGLTAPRFRGGEPIDGNRVLIHRQGDHFAASLTAAIAAGLDEHRIRTTIRAIPQERWESTKRSDNWDYRVAQVVPGLRSPAILLAEAYAAAGETERAGTLIRAVLSRNTIAPAELTAAAQELPALVLGRREPTLFLDSSLQGMSRDPLGRARFDRLYWPRDHETGTP